MRKLFILLIFILTACPVYGKEFCYKDAELSTNLEPIFLGGTNLYHHTSQGMCVAGNYIIYTRFESDSAATTYVLIDIKTKKEVTHYDFNTLHSNSLTYNPDTGEVVAVSKSHAFVFDLVDDQLIFKSDIILSNNCPKIAYVESEHAYYLGTGSAIYKSTDLTNLERQFSVSEIATNQGMGTDGKYLYIIWYRESNNQVHVYDLSGKLVRKMTLISPTYKEIEDIDFYKDKMVVNLAFSGELNGVYYVNPVHDFDKWIIDKKPTCAKTGQQHHVCKQCKKKEDTEIPATGKHKSGDWQITKEPTCEEEGEHIKTCKVCQKLMNKEAIPALGHVYSRWERTKEPTVLEEGEKKRVCSRCKKEETVAINKLPAYVKLNIHELPMRKKQKTNAITVALNTGDHIKRWSSDNYEVASVDQSGEITALKRGSANITVVSEGGAKESVHITVQWLPVFTQKLKMQKNPVTLKSGESYELHVEKIPVTSWNKIRFKSLDKKIATVTENGKIVGRKKGKTKVRVSSWRTHQDIDIIVN